MEAVITASDEQDVPLAVLSRSLKSKSKSRGSHIYSNCHVSGVQFQFQLAGEMRVDGCSRRRCCNACLGPGYLLLSQGSFRDSPQVYLNYLSDQCVFAASWIF